MPRKGTDGYAIERGFRMVDALGYDDVILKSDQVHSRMALKEGIQRKDERKCTNGGIPCRRTPEQWNGREWSASNTGTTTSEKACIGS